MTNTVKLFVICCGLIANIHSIIGAMESDIAEYIDNNLHTTKGNEYIQYLNSNYNNLSNCIKKQLTQIDNASAKNDIYEQNVKKFVMKSLASTTVALNKLIESYKPNLYFVSSEYKNYAIENIGNVYCGTYNFDEVENAFNDAKFCELLNKCHLGLSVILDVFSYLKQNNYDIEYFDEIKTLSLEIKNSLT